MQEDSVHGASLPPDVVIRPCWPDEAERARAIMGGGVQVMEAERLAGGVHFFGLFRTEPVERFCGVIAWAELGRRPGRAVFWERTGDAVRDLRPAFFAAFRQFICGPEGPGLHSLEYISLQPEDSPVCQDLVTAGFRQGLVNELFAFTFREGGTRFVKSRKHWERLQIRPGAAVVRPEPAHLEDLVRLCAGIYDLMPGLFIAAALGQGGPGIAPGFDPGDSWVYLEDGRLRGCLLVRRRDRDCSIPVRAVDPEAEESPGRVCHWLFEAFYHSYAAGEAPEWIHVSADPDSHAETVRLVKRYRGRRTGAAARLEACRERRLRAFCTGNARSGTTTLAAMLEGLLQSGHEPSRGALIAMLRRRRAGSITEGEIDRFLLERDARIGLEFESSTFLFFVIDRLVVLFPEARFVTLVRDPAEWAASMLRYVRGRRMPADAKAFLTEVTGVTDFSDHPATVEALLRFWDHHVAYSCAVIPPERHLVLRTEELSTAAPRKLAAFLSLPPLALLQAGRCNTTERAAPPAVSESLIRTCCPQWARFSPESP